MKATIFGLALAFSPISFASNSQINDVISDINQGPVKLDIDKIISQTDVTGVCGVQHAELVYLDHKNQKHVLTYFADGECRSDRI
jgi:hypothetical protein